MKNVTNLFSLFYMLLRKDLYILLMQNFNEKEKFIWHPISSPYFKLCGKYEKYFKAKATICARQKAALHATTRYMRKWLRCNVETYEN